MIQAISKTLRSRYKLLGELMLQKRFCSKALIPYAELVERRNYLFAAEQKKQLEEVGRVEKITVEVAGPPEDLILVMNQGISTPYDCCRHISEGFCQQTPLALVNDQYLWDMHTPLQGNCTLKFLNFKDGNTFHLNKAFWRTGSFVLGAVITKAFKEEAGLLLHSFPPPLVKSGSFIYDVTLKSQGWSPSFDELKVLSLEFLSFVNQNLKIECMKVKKSIALEIFEGNPHKQKQIPDIASASKDNLVTLYKVGDHIDMSCGPMVANTSFFGRCAVTAVHVIYNLELTLHRFQAIALPKGIMLNQFAFETLMDRASRLNEANPPGLKDEKYDLYGITEKPSKTDFNPQPFGESFA